MKSVTFNEGLEVLESYICENSGLERVSLPTTLKEIESSAFSNCKFLKHVSLPDFLEKIGYKCFAYSGIESIVIPKNIKVIEKSTFYQCV